MKRLLTLFIFAFTIILNNNAQIQTPRGHLVTVSIHTEFSPGVIEDITNNFQANYPNAEILQPASNLYNCHSYAWYKSEGGTIDCWLSQSPDLHWYWDDGSYVETLSQYAEKVFYYDGDHSAIISPTNSSKYESKWGYLPLVRHDPNYVPYSQPSHRRYYLWNMSFSGSSIIYGSSNQSYTLDHVPANATSYTLFYNTQLLTLVSTNGKTITVKPKTSTTVGDAYVGVNINFNSGSSKTIPYYIGIGGPHYNNVSMTVTRASDGALVYPNGIGVGPNKFYYANFQGIPSGYTISMTSPQITVYSVSGNQVYFKVNDAGYAMLTVNTISPYGVTKYIMGVTLYGGG